MSKEKNNMNLTQEINNFNLKFGDNSDDSENNYEYESDSSNEDIEIEYENDLENHYKKIKAEEINFDYNLEDENWEINQEMYKLNKKVNDVLDEEEDESEDEGIDDYKEDGYHTVFVGEILNDRYVIIEKLGWGHFSTVWLAKDFKYNSYVAIKIQKSAPHYLEAAYDEVEILQKAVKMTKTKSWVKKVSEYKNINEKNVSIDDCHVVQLLNSFIYEGPYGKHFSMVFEVLGMNLLEVMKKFNYKGIPINQVRKIVKECLIGLDYLHNECKIIHTDLKPENVLVCLTDKQLNNIIEKGQLKKNSNRVNRVETIKNIIKGIEKEEIDNKNNLIEEELQNDLEEVNKLKTMILSEEDVNQLYLLRINNENLNKKEKKKLKKNLRKKLKKNMLLPEFEDLLKTKLELKKKYGNNFENLKISETIDNEDDFDYNDFHIKIADLGNGCWTHYHFQPEIQTRQYRSPETILEVKYNNTADIWSLACMTYEILTSDFIFDPKKDKNNDEEKEILHTKNDDHILQMIETLGIFPKNFSQVGVKWKRFFNDEGLLKRVQEYQMTNLFQNLLFNHMFNHKEAFTLTTLLLPMFKIKPAERANAIDLMNHPWLNDKTIDNNYQIEEKELKEVEEYMKNNDNNDVSCFFSKFYFDQKYNKYVKYLDSNFSFKNEYIEDEEFYAQDSDIENEEDESISEPIDKYEEVLRPFERNFKDTYVGYDSGIDISLLDNTHNWQFDKKKLII